MIIFCCFIFFSSHDFGEKTVKESNLIRLHTLYYADKQKIDYYILELLVQLHHLVTFARYRHNPMRPMASTTRTSPPKGHHFQSKKRLQLISLDCVGGNGKKPLVTQLCEEDRRLLEEATTRRKSLPGISKSEDLALTKKKEATVWHLSKSVGSSHVQGFFATRLGLDVMDGLL